MFLEISVSTELGFPRVGVQVSSILAGRVNAATIAPTGQLERTAVKLINFTFNH